MIKIDLLWCDFLTNYQNKIKSKRNAKLRKTINRKINFLNLRIEIKKFITILKTNKFNYKLYKLFFRSCNSI